jgi:hypothetical protein
MNSNSYIHHMITTIAKDFDFDEEHDVNLANFAETKHN